MIIASICQREIVTLAADASLREAACSMREHHVGALVVTDATAPARVVGVITDRDLAIDVLAQGLNANGMCVGQLVHGSAIAVSGNASLQQAVAAMESGGVRRLLVTGEDGRVIGLVSVDDLVDAIAAEVTGLARALHSGIARENVERPAVAPEPVDRPVFLPLGTLGMH
jgi:CBS domain-containing protein